MYYVYICYIATYILVNLRLRSDSYNWHLYTELKWLKLKQDYSLIFTCKNSAGFLIREYCVGLEVEITIYAHWYRIGLQAERNHQCAVLVA